jgi:hypothetical protein
MKSVGNSTLSDIIQYDVVGGSSIRPLTRTQWFDDLSSTWTDFEDIEGRTLTFSNKNKRYDSQSFLPPSSKIDFTLNNFNQIYSTGSGNPKASILKKNRLVRAWSGFEINTGVRATASDDFTSGKFVHTQKSSNTVILKQASYTGTVSSGADFTLYGGGNYGGSNYDPAGYYHNRIEISDGESVFFEWSANVSSSNFDVRFRTAPTTTAMEYSGWGNFIPLSSGSNTITVNKSLNDDYLEYLVRFKAPYWTASDKINSINYQEFDRVYMFNRGTYILDEPDYDDTKVKCGGRDYLKKALETKINLPSYTTATNIQTVITGIFDRCSIPYDTAKWDITSTTVSVSNTLATKFNNISGWKATDLCMDAINAGNDDWRIKNEEDGGLSLKIIPTDREADWNAHYLYNIERINKDFDSDKQLQRTTMVNKDIVVNSESLLKSYSGTASSVHLTYGSAAIYVRYTDENGVIQTEDNRSNTAIDFTLSGSAADIKVYGCTPRNAITDEIWAECGNANNIIKNEGSTYKRDNAFFDQSMADAWCSYMIERNSDPRKKITLSMVSNPMLELNDKVTVFDLYTYSDDIYNLQEIRETWKEPVLKDQLVLEDAGVDIGDFIWDRNGWTEGLNDLKFDTGLTYDQDLPISGSDDTDYSNTKKVVF